MSGRRWCVFEPDGVEKGGRGFGRGARQDGLPYLAFFLRREFAVDFQKHGVLQPLQIGNDAANRWNATALGGRGRGGFHAKIRLRLRGNVDFHFLRDAEFFNALAKGGPCDAEQFCRLNLVAACLFQGVDDEFSLDGGEEPEL